MLPVDLFAAVDRYNAGESIPAVSLRDLNIAIDFLADMRAKVRRTGETGSAADSQVGILLEDLAERCGPDTDVFALFLRVALCDAVLQDMGKSQFAKMDQLLQAVATLPFQASELEDLTALRRRIDQNI